MITHFLHRFENVKVFLNSSTIISGAHQTERTILAGTLTVAESLSKAQTHANLPEATSMRSMSRVTSGSSVVPRASSAVAVVEPTAETAPVTSTTDGRVTSSEIIEKMETSTNTAQTSPIKPERSLTNTVPNHKSQADATTFIQTTQVGDTTEKKDSLKTHVETVVTCFTETVTTADIRSASPIPEPITEEATNLLTNSITSESREIGLEDTFRTSITETETNTGEPDLPGDQTTETLVPGTAEPPKDETSTVRPKESTQISDSSTAMNKANSIKHTATIAGTTENTDKKQLSITAADASLTKTNVLITTIESRFTSHSSPHISTLDLNTVSPVRPSVTVFHKFTQSHKTLSPCKGKCKSKSKARNPAGRQDNRKVPLTYDKTLYSAITMGCLLVLCSILAFIVFIKDFVW